MTVHVALLVTDVPPTRELSESLARSGYYIEFAYSSEAALARLDTRAPTLAVVGPLARCETVLLLLEKLAQLRIHTIVMCQQQEVVAAAQRFDMQVRAG